MMSLRGRFFGRRRRGLVPAFLLSVLLVGAVGCTAAPKGGDSGSDSTTTTSSPPTTVARSGELVSPAEQVAADVGMSVVHIQVQGEVQGVFGSQTYDAEGSGVIFNSDGMIVTNNHVISRNDRPVDSIEVRPATGETIPATLVGRDPFTDLAVVKVERQGLPAAHFLEDLSEVRPGQYAIAIGSPLGYSNSVTLGVVSGLHREIPYQGVEGMALIDLIQTDAAISPGNSGGALVDAEGRVIGVNVAYLPPQRTGAQDLGFAIPADVVVDIANQIVETGNARHPYIGIQTVTVTEQLQQRFDLSRADGVLVAGVGSGTPAQEGGLEQGDIITEIDGEAIKDDTDLFTLLRRRRVGETIEMVVDRQGKEVKVEVSLGERPARGRGSD